MKPRTIVVSQQESGQPLAKVLRGRLGWSWSEVNRAVADGRVRVNNAVCRNPMHRVTRGLRLQIASASRAGGASPLSAKRPRNAKKLRGLTPPAQGKGPTPVI